MTTKTVKQVTGKIKHYHVWDLPKNILPRSKANKSKSYAQDLVRLYQSLSFTNKKLQESAQISIFHIKSITSKKGYYTSPKEVFPCVQDFVYHYENFCYRTYVVREKILQFINAVLPIGYQDDQVKISHLIVNPIVKNSGILSEIQKFNKRKALGKVISDRKNLTHKLYFTDVDHYLRPRQKSEKKGVWFKDWSKEIMIRAKLANSAISDLSKINHGVSEKIIAYKNKK